MKTWADVIDEVRRAIASRDWDAGERAVATLRREAEHQGDPESLSSAAFYAGMFHDARGTLEEAEAAFGEAVSWDERALGPHHEAVADALRSLAMVQVRRQRLDAATRSYERAADVYAKCGKRAFAVEARRSIGDAMRRAERWLDADAAYERALAASAGATEPAVRAERAYALVGRSESMRHAGEIAAAYGFAVEATREGALPTHPALDTALGAAWLTIAFLARRALRREEEAVLAYAMARDLTHEPAHRRRAAEAVEESPSAALGRARVEGAVVAAFDASRGTAVVYDARLGVRIVRTATARVAGERVELEQSPSGAVRITSEAPGSC